MPEFDRLRRQAERFKAMYPVGTRIELISMEDPWAPVPTGTRGTVVAVDDIGQMHMQWDNGRTLAVVPGVDSFRKLTEKELEAERASIDATLADATSRAGKPECRKGDKDMDIG